MSVTDPKNIIAMILMAGMVRHTNFTHAIQRHVVNLPVSNDKTILDVWLENISRLNLGSNANTLKVRIIRDINSPQVWYGEEDSGSNIVCLEQDPKPLRGTGGVLHDITRSYSANDYVLVANSSHLIIGDFQQVVENLRCTNADIALAATPNKTPLDVMLVKCEVLNQIQDVGYVDFKEQVLGATTTKFQVKLVAIPDIQSHRISSLDSYINAIKSYHINTARETGASYDEYDCVFRIVENTKLVNKRAIVHNSVVLRNAQVAADATVVRSLVGPSAVIKEGQSVIDDIEPKEMLR